MKKKSVFSLSGILILVILGLLVCFLVINIYVYQDLKTVEHSVFNLYNQVRTQNSKIDQFGASDENIVQQSMKFSEATKNWQTYQNNEFELQLKNPTSWGNFEAYIYTADGQNYVGRRLDGKFDKFGDDYLNITAESYDFYDIKNIQSQIEPSRSYKYSSHDVYEKLFLNEIGECNNEMFAALKNLQVGEIRNCFVRENILKQKFIVYRYAFSDAERIVNQLVAVYPREDYYVMTNLPDDILDEVDYFIQSIIFMQ